MTRAYKRQGSRVSAETKQATRTWIAVTSMATRNWNNLCFHIHLIIAFSPRSCSSRSFLFSPSLILLLFLYFSFVHWRIPYAVFRWTAWRLMNSMNLNAGFCKTFEATGNSRRRIAHNPPLYGYISWGWSQGTHGYHWTWVQALFTEVRGRATDTALDASIEVFHGRLSSSYQTHEFRLFCCSCSIHDTAIHIYHTKRDRKSEKLFGISA